MDSLALELESKRVLLPNGWSLSPAGKSLPLGDLPLNIVASPDGKLMAVTNNGQSKQSLMLIDADQEVILDETKIGKSWYGLAFDKTGTKLYASGGNDNRILIYDIRENRLVKSDSFVLGKPWPENKISPTGIALDDKRKRLYITTKEDSALYIADLTNHTAKKIALGHEAYNCLLSPDHGRLYISLWGGHQVVVIDTENQKLIQSISVGSNPNDLVLTRDGKYLFVSHGNDNSVSVIETASGKVLEVLNTALYPQSLLGSTPNAVALSENEERLYIANR